MDAMKINRRKSKVFGCFKPVGSGDEPRCDLKSPPSVSGDESDRSRKKSSRRRLYGAVKAVFCIKMPLAKKLESENPNKVLQRSFSDLSSQNLVKSMNKSFSFSDPTLISRTTSLISSSSSSSLTASSTLSLSLRSSSSFTSNMSEASAPLTRSVSRPINGQKSIKRDMDGGKCVARSPSVGMCVLLVCLVSLVFWGKVFAIVTSTLTLLFFGPASGGAGGAASRRRFKDFESLENELFESEEYKKRVVMEGLLERNRPVIRKLSF